MPTTHHKYSPSTLKYRDLCPGWLSDPESDGAAALEGTLCHKAFETGDLSILVTDEQRKVVQMCLDYSLQFEKNALEVHKERKLTILKGLTEGTSDRVIITKPARQKHAHVIDPKFGYVAVDDAKNNVQGICYALGTFESFPVETTTVHFLQPRLDEVSTHRFTRADIPNVAQTIRAIITRCQIYEQTQNEKMLNPSEAACLYCGRKATCPALHRHAYPLAKVYAPLELVEIEGVHSSTITAPEKMSKVLTVARILEKWCASVKTHAMAMVDGGTPVPGYEIRERAGAVTIQNPVLAYGVLKEFGLDDVEIVSAAELSKTKLEEFVKAGAAHGQKAKRVAALNAALASADCLTSGNPVRYLQRSRE